MKKSNPKYQPGGSTPKAKVKTPATKKNPNPYKIEPVWGLPDWKSRLAKMFGNKKLEKDIRTNRRIFEMQKNGGSTYSPGDMSNYTTSSKGNVAPGMQTTFDSIPENNMYGGEKRKKKK